MTSHNHFFSDIAGCIDPPLLESKALVRLPLPQARVSDRGRTPIARMALMQVNAAGLASFHSGVTQHQRSRDMTSHKLSSSEIVERIKARWEKLTDEDVHHGLQRREHLLDRLRLRHGLGLDDAQAQLHDFETRNPELLFERS